MLGTRLTLHKQVCSVDRYHNVRSLDHSVRLLASRELELVHRFVRDRGGDDLPTHVEQNMAGRCTFPDLLNGAFDHIALSFMRTPLSEGLSRPYSKMPNFSDGMMM